MQAVEIINAAIFILGGLCGLGFIVWLVRGGRWRNPLAGVSASGGGPLTIHILLVLMLYVGLTVLLSQGLRPFIDIESISEPGSHGWHMVMAVDHAARLIAVVVMILILWRNRSFRPTPDGNLGVPGIVGVGILGGLIVTSVCTLQLYTGITVWQWLDPEHVMPVHAALMALKNSVWGPWGAVQLFVFAVVVAPLAEELFFRGLVLQTVWRYTRHAWLAIVVSAALFGLIHFPQPQDVLPLCTMGIMLGYIRLRTRSLTACILVHALFNTRTMILAVFFPELIGE